MGNIVTIEVKGFDELERKLYELPSKLAKKFVRKALRAAGGVFAREIQAGAQKHDRTGWMSSQVAITTHLSSGDQEGSANIGFRKKQNPARLGKDKNTPNAANEAYWLELGRKGEPAKPFMRSAYEAVKHRALAVFEDVLKEELKEVVK